jgi:hypothetical protein
VWRQVPCLTLGNIEQIDIAIECGVGLVECNPLFVPADGADRVSLFIFVEQRARIGLGIVAVHVEHFWVTLIAGHEKCSAIRAPADKARL